MSLRGFVLLRRRLSDYTDVPVELRTPLRGRGGELGVSFLGRHHRRHAWAPEGPSGKHHIRVRLQPCHNKQQPLSEPGEVGEKKKLTTMSGIWKHAQWSWRFSLRERERQKEREREKVCLQARSLSQRKQGKFPLFKRILAHFVFLNVCNCPEGED